MIKIAVEMLDKDPYLPQKLRELFESVYQGKIIQAMLSGDDPDGILKDGDHDTNN